MKALRFIALCLAVAALYFASVVLIPLALAVFLAVLLDPFVRTLENRGLRRPVAVPAVVVSFLAATAVLAWPIYRACAQVAAELPRYTLRLHELLSRYGNGDVPALPRWVPGPGAWAPVLLHGAGTLFEAVSIAVFVPLLLFALLLDKPNLKESFNTLVGKHLFVPTIDRELSSVMRHFVAGNGIGIGLLAVAHGLTLHLLGFEKAAALGLVSGALNVIPIVGLPLALVLPFAQALLQFDDVSPFLIVGAAFSAYHFLMGNVVLPRLIGSRVNVNSTAVLAGLLFWGWLWGGMGFLLAIPLTALAKILLEAHPDCQVIANLFAKRPRHVRRDAPRRVPRTAPAAGARHPLQMMPRLRLLPSPSAVIRRLRPVPAGPAPIDPAAAPRAPEDAPA